MPIYEYHCEKCGKDHETMRKFSDKPLKICPSCGGKLEKKLSLSGFQLKGGGWYKDGYASKKPDTSSPPAKKEPAQSSQTAPATPASGGPASPPKKEKSGP